MIEVLKAGLNTSFQDQGRLFHRDKGVPVSGAMDLYAMKLANRLVDNNENEAVIECTLMGPELFFNEECYISITGAEFSIKLNNKLISSGARVYIPPKSTLKMGNAKNGIYGYIAIEGGYAINSVLGSFSHYPTIAPELKLTKGQKINYQTSSEKLKNYSRVAPIQQHFSSDKIDVLKGPEFSKLNVDLQKQLFNTSYTIGQTSNRMSTQLEHSKPFSASEIITCPVQPGTVQLTPDGKLMCLMRDAQTTGGYARIFQLTAHAIQVLAQKRAGEKVIFRAV